MNHPNPDHHLNTKLFEEIRQSSAPCGDSLKESGMTVEEAYAAGVYRAAEIAVILTVDPVRCMIGRPYGEEAKERRRISRRILRDLVGYSKEQLADKQKLLESQENTNEPV